jgi:hypothetical protein
MDFNCAAENRLSRRIFQSPGGILHRETRAQERANPDLLRKLQERGYSIDQSEEIQWYLDYRQTNAATFLQGDLLLRPDARTVEVLEEYLHNVQRKIGLTEKMTLRELEVHVKEFMLRHRRLCGISEADAHWIKTWLELAGES